MSHIELRPEFVRIDPSIRILTTAHRRGRACMTQAEQTSHTPSAQLVSLTIDGDRISVPEGTLVIRAAELLGIQIPRFCDHPLLEPVGACRQCLVEVDGQRKPMASCTIVCTPDMVVRTQHSSEAADRAQRGVMELLLINHPLDCPVCDKGGECPLQNQAIAHGRTETRFEDVKRTYLNRSACRPRCCWTASAACSALAAPGSPARSPEIRSSICSNAAPGNR